MFWARNNVSLTGAISNQADHFYVYLHQNITTCPGRNYTYSGNYYLPSNNVLYPTFALYPRSEDITSWAGDGASSTTGRWGTLRGSFVAKGRQVEFTLDFTSRNMMNDGDFYADRIVVKVL